MKLKTIDFLENYNNKLTCSAFTTFRLTPKYSVGDWVIVMLKSNALGRAVVLDVEEMTPMGLSDYDAYLDVGKGVSDLMKILQKCHPNEQITPTRPLYRYLLRYETATEKQERQAKEKNQQLQLM